MTNQYIEGLLLVVVLAGSATDTQCLKNTVGKMPCIEIEKSLFVKAGDNLTLNCSCFSKTNGQWSGPNKESRSTSTAGGVIPYTLGTELNKKLNKSKYRVYGGYDVKTCNLMITNFLAEDDGKYICHYITNMDPSTIYVNVYYIVAINKPTENQKEKSTQTEIYTFETKQGLPDGQYYEIETINNTSARIHGVPNNVQEPETVVDRLPSQSDDSLMSSESSVQSMLINLMNEDGYENPYQTIDPENIEMHPYSIVTSQMYQNTIIFPNEITEKSIKQAIQKNKERGPWLIIYKKTRVNE